MRALPRRVMAYMLNVPAAGRLAFAWPGERQAASGSIRLRKHHAPRGRLARHHALARFLRPVEGNAANRRLGLGGDAVFGFAGAVPVGPRKPPGSSIFFLKSS